MSFFRFMGWGKNLAKTTGSSNDKIECYCSDSNGFYLTKRQASVATSISIILLTLMLVIGYLWGQRNAIGEFTSKVVNDSFADQVNYSMHSMYKENNAADEDETEEKENELEEVNPEKQSIKKEIDAPVQVQQINNVPGLKHYAQLVGFGSRKNAEQFVNKLQKKGYTIVLIPRKSKTANNKVITWYQAVTEKFDNKADLEKVVDEIKVSERLNDIKFMTSTN